MTALVWDGRGDHRYEIGVDRGVLYPRGGPGVAWDGLVSVSERIINRTLTPFYMDGVKYADGMVGGDFEATISAISVPYEFAMLDGAVQLAGGLLALQQPRFEFGVCYRTLIGNDILREEYGYKLHFIYNARTSPSAVVSKTLSENVDISVTDRIINTRPIEIPGKRPSAHLVVDSTRVDPDGLAMLEDIIYGTETTAPRLPTPTEILDLVGGFIVADILDGGTPSSGAVDILDGGTP